MKFVFNPHDSEEIAQDVFMKVFEKGVGLDPESGRIRNFIFAIARNRSVDFIKGRKMELEKIRKIHFEEAVLDRDFYRDIENLYIEGELISTLYDTINSFSEEEKKIYLESAYNDKKNAVVSRELNISSYKLKKILNSLNCRIRERISQYK